MTRLTLAGCSAFSANVTAIFVVLDDVDLFAAQFADDRLHAHALHAHARADGVHVFVFRHDGDLGALAGFTGDGADHNRAVVNFRDFGLEQVLHQFRRGARNHNLRPLRRFLDAHDHDAHALADRRTTPAATAPCAACALPPCRCRRSHPGPSMRFTVAFTISPTRADVFVVDGVALGFADFLENHLLGKLRRNASQDSFGRPSECAVRRPTSAFGSIFARVFQRDLQSGIFDLLRRLDHCLHRKRTDLAAFPCPVPRAGFPASCSTCGWRRQSRLPPHSPQSADQSLFPGSTRRSCYKAHLPYEEFRFDDHCVLQVSKLQGFKVSMPTAASRRPIAFLFDRLNLLKP